ncbi:thiamine phosphate synthase [Poseidonocella sp. HB161398]|uniref:thiamine phosphate synthase n=1 Tax=Poseidonocella sp. HB161398 TaxID=2320855 RepID=UPI001107E186|nr:thiamine phosphate synthase [Poseidonocella sp. HB161398]
MRPIDLSVYLVLDPELCAAIGMVETAVRAVEGGATAVQLRDKAAPHAELVATGRALKAALAGTGVPLIVNDDVAAAIEIGADGLHIGQGDMLPHEARMRIGPEMILGLSVETPEHAAAADPRLVDYVGAGPVFATATKPGHAAPTGFGGLARIIAATPLPAVAIGGVKHGHAAEAVAAGARGLAVVSAICGRPDPARAARVLVHAMKKAREA